MHQAISYLHQYGVHMEQDRVSLNTPGVTAKQWDSLKSNSNKWECVQLECFPSPFSWSRLLHLHTAVMVLLDNKEHKPPLDTHSWWPLTRQLAWGMGEAQQHRTEKQHTWILLWQFGHWCDVWTSRKSLIFSASIATIPLLFFLQPNGPLFLIMGCTEQGTLRPRGATIIQIIININSLFKCQGAGKGILWTISYLLQSTSSQIFSNTSIATF